MGFRGKQVVRNTEKAVRRAAVAADTTVVLATPFDTGRARANWITSIGSPLFFHVGDPEDEFDKSGGPALAQGKGVISGWRLRAGPIFITNSLPYIVELDGGSSTQAPNGMSAQAVVAAVAELKKARLLRK